MLDLKQRSDKARLRSWDVFKSLYTLERSVAPLLHLKCLYTLERSGVACVATLVSIRVCCAAACADVCSRMLTYAHVC
jgi:SUMO ligase MMS21 Smc5/6 complex component